MKLERALLLTIAPLCFILCGGVVYWAVKTPNPSDTVTLYGNVDVRQVDIGFRVFGRVAAMPFEEGDFVSKGSCMASLEENPYADQLREALAAAKAVRFSLENAKTIYQRRKALIAEGGVSQEEYDNALSAKNVLQEELKQARAALGVAAVNYCDTRAYCPADGTILTRIREPGTVVLQGEPVYTLSVISPVWIRAYVPERLLGEIYPGMEGDILTDTRHGKVYRGKIGFISPVAEFTPKTVESTELRTDLVYRIRVYADNPDWGLKQGMPVTVKLSLGKRNSNPR